MRSRSLAVFSCLIALMMVYSAVYASDGPFGVGVQTDLEAVDGASAAAIQPDGKIVVAGPSGADFALARNGSAEPVRVTFDPPNIRIGGSFNATFLGPNLTNETYFDLRFRGPDELTHQVVLNWQQGPSASHSVPDTTASGTWTVTGVRVHQDPNDESGMFHPLCSTITVNSMLVTLVRIEGAGLVLAGNSFTATFAGANLTDDTYFDVRFRSPMSETEQVARNWQRGRASGTGQSLACGRIRMQPITVRTSSRFRRL